MLLRVVGVQVAHGGVELKELAEELAGLWPAPLPPWWPWGQWYDDDQ